MNNEVTYEIGNVGNIDEVRELWGELNKVHIEKSLYFEEYYAGLTFEDRKRLLQKKADQGAVFIVLACDGERKVGHCIAGFEGGIGTIESLFVKPEYRRARVGSELMGRALDWLKGNDPCRINLMVAVGNEEAFGFYERYGFKPRATELQLRL